MANDCVMERAASPFLFLMKVSGLPALFKRNKVVTAVALTMAGLSVCAAAHAPSQTYPFAVVLGASAALIACYYAVKGRVLSHRNAVRARDVQKKSIAFAASAVCCLSVALGGTIQIHRHQAQAAADARSAHQSHLTQITQRVCKGEANGQILTPYRTAAIDVWRDETEPESLKHGFKIIKEENGIISVKTASMYSGKVPERSTLQIARTSAGQCQILSITPND